MATRRGTRLALVLLSAVAVAGCKGERTLMLTDTEGRQFEARCEAKQKRCVLIRTGKLAKRQEGEAASLRHSGRLVGVCDVRTEQTLSSDADCRALECSSADECPPLHGLDAGHCLNGLCIDPANPLNTSDAVMLCLAGTGLGRNAPMQVERYALALNCGDPCRIPAPCRQP
jgi:hypothetical protein